MNTKNVILVLVAGAFCGCTHLKRTETIVSRQLAEESRALTTGVVDALQLQPPEERDRFTEVALEFARQDQRIEGLPLKSFDAPAVVESTNVAGNGTMVATFLPSEVKRRFAFQDRLRAKEFAVREKLIDIGVAHEEERNARIVAWTKWLGGGSLLAGGLVALCVFFPAATPIVGRLLAWLVGKIPSLAGAAGVVSTKAFDAVVSAIEATRRSQNGGRGETGPTIRAGNQLDGKEESVLLDELHLNLSRAMDAEHKALVRKRKSAMALA